MPAGLFLARAPGKRHLSHEGIVERAPESVDVGGRPSLVGRANLLGSHVVHRADHPPEACRFLLHDAAGQAEIEHLHPTVGRDEQVARLHVAMHEALVVGVCQPAGGLHDDRRSRDIVQHAIPSHLLSQVEPVNQLGDEVIHLAVVPGIERPHEVVVIEPAEQADLAPEGGFRLGRRLLARQHLDGHLAAHHHVLRLEHPAHAPLADGIEDLVLAEGELAAADEHLLGLKRREQALGDEQVGQRPIVRHIAPLGRPRTHFGLGGIHLGGRHEAAGQRRFAKRPRLPRRPRSGGVTRVGGGTRHRVTASVDHPDRSGDREQAEKVYRRPRAEGWETSATTPWAAGPRTCRGGPSRDARP